MKKLSLVFLLLIFNAVAWFQVWQLYPRDKSATIYFLDVGQGDSELINFGDVQLLIDGGPNASVLNDLEKALPDTDRYIDLVLLTHPHLDHFGGLIDVFKNYKIGTLLDNGFKHEIPQYQDFLDAISINKIKHITLAEGDKIKYKDWELDIIWPPPNAPPPIKDIHDNTIIFLLKNNNFRGLFTGDINFNVEEKLLKKQRKYLSADLLKVSHHGSKNSTSDKFLKAVKPQIAIIEVGKNSYGHPNPQAINRLKDVGASVYTTLNNGLIKVVLENKNLHIFSEKY